MKGKGRIGAWHEWQNFLWHQREKAEEQARRDWRRPTGRHRPGWQLDNPKGQGRVGKGWHFANWDDKKEMYHALWQNRAEEEELGPEWRGGRVADYAVAAGTRTHTPAPKPSRPSAKSSGNLADYYFVSLPEREPIEFAMPNITGRWLDRGGQEIWRGTGVHVNNKHANLRRGDCRLTCADLITLALRDRKDFLTGDWNQAGNYLEECCYHAVRAFEARNNVPYGTIPWRIPGNKCEIRTIFFNWPVNGKEYYMAVKEMTRFSKYSTEDFGLNPTDTDAHVPQFFMLKKWPKDSPAATKHQIFHPYSAEGQDKKRERQNQKKKRSRQAKAKARYQEQMKARAAAKAASASASSEAAASLNQPLWLRPAPVAEETEPGLPSGSEEDSHSMSSGLQEQAEASAKGEGKDPTIIRDLEQAEAYGKGEGSTSRSATTSQANERGPGLSSGPRNRTRSSGKGRRKGKGKSEGTDKRLGHESSHAGQRKKAKGKQCHLGGKTTWITGWWQASHLQFQLSTCDTRRPRNRIRRLYHRIGG